MNEIRLALEKSIFDQFGPKLAIVKIVPATEDNPQGLFVWPIPVEPDTSDRVPTPPLDRVLMMTMLDLELPILNFPIVDDIDLIAIPNGKQLRFGLTLDVMVLQLIVDRWGQADQKFGPDNEQDLGKLYTEILKLLTMKKNDLAVKFSEGLPKSRLISIPGRSNWGSRGSQV